MNKIIKWWQNRKIRPAAWPKNLVVLYLLCIIVPLAITDTIFISMLIGSNRADRQYSYEKTAENIAFGFGNIIDDASDRMPVSVPAKIFCNRSYDRRC